MAGGVRPLSSPAFARDPIERGTTMTSPVFVRRTLCAALLAALALPAAAAEPAFHARASAGVVHVEPTVRAPAWQLRVMGPDGAVGEDTLLDREPLRIEPKLLHYPRWLDGSYQFELIPVLGDRNRGDSEAAQAPSTRRALGATSTGNFRVQGGQLVVAEAATEAAPVKPAGAGTGGGTVEPAQTIADNLVVQGSICSGFDCVEPESFGADTIRLKENNLRIHFDDTSTSAGFAANDWRLVANDQASGGASFFAIEDSTAARIPFKIAAGAPANALFMSNTGNLGLGTATPSLDVQMTTTDTPAVRFEQTAAGGFTAQTWDIGANEANWFVRDVTGGSRLPLRIRPGAPTSSVDINASGNVGLGIASPTSQLHLARTTGPVGVRLERTTGTLATKTNWIMFNEETTGRLHFTDDTAVPALRVPFKIGRNGVQNLLRVGVLATDAVDINGNLTVVGNITVSGTVGPDYVFAPGFALPTIDEHAEQMRRERFLPKVGPARVEDGHGVIDLGAMSHGMLEELEYAHLYIAQLDDTVGELQGELAERDAQLRQLQAEVEAIKAALAAH
jgi:hypothetical protein